MSSLNNTSNSVLNSAYIYSVLVCWHLTLYKERLTSGSYSNPLPGWKLKTMSLKEMQTRFITMNISNLFVKNCYSIGLFT